MTQAAPAERIAAAVHHRFGEDCAAPDPATPGLDALCGLVEHRSQRRYADRAVEPALLRLLCAAALSAPSKSDLQQRDIVVLEELRAAPPRHVAAARCVDRRGAVLSRVLRQQPPPAANS